MNDKHKTKAQLIGELEVLRRRVAQMEGAEQSQTNHGSFRDWIETAASAIYIWQDSVFRYTNPAFSKLTGYTAEEASGANVWNLVHPEHRELIGERVLAWQRGEPVPPRSEFKILRKSGEIRWVDADSTFIDFDGSPAALTIAYDSTLNKLAEEALKESERRYREIVETAQEAIWVVDADARTTYVNQHLTEMLGYAKEELWGRAVFDFVDDADRADALRYLERGRSGVKEQHDFRFRRRDGSEIWTMVSTTPLFDGEGVFIGGLAMLIDITERRKSEEALRKSEVRWRTYIEQANDLIFTLDRLGRMVSVNKAASAATGFTGEELLGKLPQELVVPEHQDLADSSMRSILAGIPLGQIEVDILSKDGRRISLEIRGTILYDGDQVSGGFEIARDITDRKKADQALKESEARLQAAIENLPFEFWVRDTNGRCTMQNPYSVLQWGSQIGSLLEDMSLDRVTAELWDASNRRALGDEVVKGEYEITEGEQAGCYYNIIAPIRVDGEVSAILGVNIDITERKRAEEALRESEAKFRALAETAAAAIFIYQGSNLVYVNPMTRAHTGYDREELLRIPFWEIIHPDSRDLVRERGLARQRGEALPERYEFKIIAKSGETRWVDATAVSIEYQGKPAALGTAFDITERKLAEEALHKTQERLRHVLSFSPATIYSLRIEGESFASEWVSESLTRLTGYEPGEALADGWWVQRIHPDDRRRVLAELPRLLTRDRLTLEYRFRHNDGGYLWLRNESKLLRDQSGKPLEVVGSWVDVTERREAEAALRESEERYRNLVENAHDIIYTYDLNGNYTSVNKAAERITGYTREEALELSLEQTIAPEYLEKARQMIAAKLAGEKETVYDLEIIAKDGRRITVEINTRLVLQDDVPIGIQGIARDVTERKRAEQALRESQAHLQAILDHCPEMIFEKDLNGRYLKVNRQFESTFNLAPEQVLGRTDDELFSPELAAAFRATDCNVLEAGRPLEFEEPVAYADGLHTYIVHKFPLLDTAGNVYAVAGISTDITARKRAEDDLRRQKETLQKIFDHIPVMIRFLDEDGRVKLVNREWQRTLGWSLEEIEGRGLDIFAELYPDPEYRKRVLNFIAESTGEFTDLKTRTRDGRVIDTTFANVRLKDGTNIGIGRDIGERKRQERALQLSNQRYRDLVEMTHDLVWSVDTEGRITYMSPASLRFYGREPEEMIGRLYTDFVPPDEARQGMAQLERVLATGEATLNFENRIWHKDGREVILLANAVVLRDEAGNNVGTAGTSQDITERKRAEEALRRQTAQLAALHEIELEISAEGELSRVLDIVTRRAAELLNAYHCSVLIRDRERAELNLAASLDGELIGWRLKEGEGLAGLVALLGHAQAIDDYSTWEGRALMSDPERFGPALSAPLKWQQTVIGAITVARNQGEEPFGFEDLHFLEQIAADAAIAIHQATLFEEVQEGHRRLQVLSHRLIDAHEAERKHLARELHDQIGQALTAVQISLQSLQHSPGIGANGDRIQESLAVIEDALQQVHDLSLDLRPSTLDDLGLIAALRWYVNRVTVRAGLVSVFKANDLDTRLAPGVETACFRIAQEALTNVLRHAHASSVSVEVTHGDSGLGLLIRDDGVGFDVRAAMSKTGPNASLGLHGMRERAAALDGLVSIESKLGCGTTVEASFPLSQRSSPSSSD